MNPSCRHLKSFTADRAWMNWIGVRSGWISQEVRPYGVAGGKHKGVVPVRCVTASKSIVRGARLCVVPPSCVVTGERANHLIGTMCEQSQRSSGSLIPYPQIARVLHSASKSAPELLGTRDGLLLTLFLYLLRSARYADLIPSDFPLRAWIHAFPPKMPPLGLLLYQCYGGGNEHTPLQRQLVMGEDFSSPLLPGMDIKKASSELMLRAMEASGLEALRTPHTEVLLTQEMLTNFFNQKRTSLTPRQHEEAAARTLSHATSAAFKHLISLESRVHEEVVLPLLRGLKVLDTTLDDPDATEEVKCMHWAHFMMRSRVVNVSWRRGPPRLALIPFLDCLNHSFHGPNVVYYENPTDGAVVVTASKTIAPGEELVLHYGDYGQRGCLFGDCTPPTGEAAAAYGKNGRSRQADDFCANKNQEVAQQVQAIEAKQMREMIDTDQSDAVPLYPLGTSSTARWELHGDRLSQHEATMEALWLWRYGFICSAAEKAFEASQQWGKRLRTRLAHLTDVRRKGRPGEFVLCVPEQLKQLRAQRERIERERYHNTRIFPPQRA